MHAPQRQLRIQVIRFFCWAHGGTRYPEETIIESLKVKWFFLKTGEDGFNICLDYKNMQVLLQLSNCTNLYPASATYSKIQTNLL